MGLKPALFIVAALMLMAVPSANQAWAGGDAAKGKKVFNKCKACHTVKEGKNRIGPSLYGIVGRQAGTVAGYKKYSASYVKAGKQGLKWEPDTLIGYLEHPKKFMAGYLKQKKAKTKMTLKLKKLQQRQDVVAYLQSLQ